MVGETCGSDPPSNDPPVAESDAATTDENVSVTIDVLANDHDPNGDPIAISAATMPANGSVTATVADVTYTPDAGYSGVDTFTYTISDGKGGTDSATVTVTVNDVPAPPSATAIHVGDIDAHATSLRGGHWSAMARVRVVDDLGAPVAGVAVSGRWNGRGLVRDRLDGLVPHRLTHVAQDRQDGDLRGRQRKRASAVPADEQHGSGWRQRRIPSDSQQAHLRAALCSSPGALRSVMSMR
jgi:hypothetical protein